MAASDAKVVHAAGAADADVSVGVDPVVAQSVSVGETSFRGEGFRFRCDAAVAAAAAKVAQRHDWNASWLNFEVASADALPTLGRAVEWETIYGKDGIVIQVAAKEALLAMTLRANRPGRDTRDIRLLLVLCGMTTFAEAEALYEDFYPGDSLSDRAVQIVTTILADGPIEAPETPPPPVI